MPKDTTHPDLERDATVEAPDHPEAIRIAAFFTYLIRDCGYREPKIIGDGRYACLMPLLFTTAIITGRVGDHIGYDDRWCFHDPEQARRALEAWTGEGEPQGWHRHPSSGRRRKLDGDQVIDEWVDP